MALAAACVSLGASAPLVRAFEPLGLAGLWLRVERYVAAWPFRYGSGDGSPAGCRGVAFRTCGSATLNVLP